MFCSLICGWLSFPTFAQTVNLLNESTATAIDDLVEDAIVANNFPGVAVGVVYDGKIVYTRGYGEAGTGSTDMTASTILRWGSISKTVTGVLAMKLVENGNIDLDDLVIDYIPEFIQFG